MVAGGGDRSVARRRFPVNLDPTIGREIEKTRPCVVISPGGMNRHIRTVIVAPMTTRGRGYPTRAGCRSKGKGGQAVLDQIRRVEAKRLVRKLGRLPKRAQDGVLGVLAKLFAP